MSSHHEELQEIENIKHLWRNGGKVIVGLLLVVFGVKSMFSLLPTLFKVLPFLGNIVDAGVGLVCWIFGLAWSLIVIAIAWLVYRPVIGILLLVAAVAGIIFLKSRSKKTVPQS